jgi:hypothetical protein
MGALVRPPWSEDKMTPSGRKSDTLVSVRPISHSESLASPQFLVDIDKHFVRCRQILVGPLGRISGLFQIHSAEPQENGGSIKIDTMPRTLDNHR